MLLVLSLLWSYLTGIEGMPNLFSDSSYEIEHIRYKLLTHRFVNLFIFMIVTNTILSLALIMKMVRISVICQFFLSLFILIGMWIERYLIIVTALPRKYLPFVWHDYYPSWVEISLISPVPLKKEIKDLFGRRKDPVKFFTFFGGLAGLFAGAIFAVGTSIIYPLPRGGRSIAAIPPILIISFETLILFGVLATFAGFLIAVRLPAIKKKPYLDLIGEDHFGLLIKDLPERPERIEGILMEGGAERVVRFGDET